MVVSIATAPAVSCAYRGLRTGRPATEPIEAPTSDCRTRIAVGDRALALFEEGILARVWPSNPFPHEIGLEGSDPPISLIGSADYRSAIRPSTACSVGTTRAIDGTSVVGVFANNRSSIGASAARAIHAIDASSSIGLMGYNRPAKHDD
jgi:hypothetical protein